MKKMFAASIAIVMLATVVFARQAFADSSRDDVPRRLEQALKAPEPEDNSLERAALVLIAGCALLLAAVTVVGLELMGRNAARLPASPSQVIATRLAAVAAPASLSPPTAPAIGAAEAARATRAEPDPVTAPAVWR